jgi:hypothetical protein
MVASVLTTVTQTRWLLADCTSQSSGNVSYATKFNQSNVEPPKGGGRLDQAVLAIPIFVIVSLLHVSVKMLQIQQTSNHVVKNNLNTTRLSELLVCS